MKTCGKIPPTKGYAPCSRAPHSHGPCAHELEHIEPIRWLWLSYYAFTETFNRMLPGHMDGYPENPYWEVFPEYDDVSREYSEDRFQDMLSVAREMDVYPDELLLTGLDVGMMKYEDIVEEVRGVAGDVLSRLRTM